MKHLIYHSNCEGKFDLKNTVINLVAGLGIISFITMFCDFILLNYVAERKLVCKNIKCMNIFWFSFRLPRRSMRCWRNTVFIPDFWIFSAWLVQLQPTWTRWRNVLKLVSLYLWGLLMFSMFSSWYNFTWNY